MKCFLQGDRFQLKFISYFRENVTKIRLKNFFAHVNVFMIKVLKRFLKVRVTQNM